MDNHQFPIDLLSLRRLLPALFPADSPPEFLCAIGNETIPHVRDLSRHYPSLRVQIAVRSEFGDSLDPLWNVEESVAAYPMETLSRAREADCLLICGTSNLYAQGRRLVYRNAAKSGCRLLMGILPPEGRDLHVADQMVFLWEMAEEFQREGYIAEFLFESGKEWVINLEAAAGPSPINASPMAAVSEDENLVAVLGRAATPRQGTLSLPAANGPFFEELRRQGVNREVIRRRIARGVQTDRFIIQPLVPWVEPAFCTASEERRQYPVRLPSDHTLASLLITSGDDQAAALPFPLVERLEDGVAYFTGSVSFWVWDAPVFRAAALNVRDKVKSLLQHVSGDWCIVLAGAFVRESSAIRFLPFRIAFFKVWPTFLSRIFAWLPSLLRNGLGLGSGQRQIEQFVLSRTRGLPGGPFFTGECASPLQALRPLFLGYQGPERGLGIEPASYLPVSDGEDMIPADQNRLVLERISLQLALGGERDALLAANAYLCGEAWEKEMSDA